MSPGLVMAGVSSSKVSGVSSSVLGSSSGLSSLNPNADTSHPTESSSMSWSAKIFGSQSASSAVRLSASAYALALSGVQSAGSRVASMCVHPSCLAACTVPLPAMITPASDTTIGLRCPNSSSDPAMAFRLLVSWVRAFSGSGVRSFIAIFSMSIRMVRLHQSQLTVVVSMSLLSLMNGSGLVLVHAGLMMLE